ncbi:MAG: DUF302 domain-containing protein [Bacteroidota bacterium]
MRKKNMRYLIITLFFLFVACKKDASSTIDSTKKNESKEEQQTTSSENKKEPESISKKNGFVNFEGIGTATDAFEKVMAILRANPGLHISTVFDHQSQAKESNQEMPFTKVMLLHNQNLTFPILRENPYAGIDLPSRILYAENQRENDQVVLTSGDFLIDRYGLQRSIQTANSNERVYATIFKNLYPEVVKNEFESNLNRHEGLVLSKSNNDFETTAKKIVLALKKHDKIDLFYAHDHQKRAEKDGQELFPSIVFYFGNPDVGTDLMKETPSLAIDLPLKIYVFENDNNEVEIVYNDMEFIFDLHQSPAIEKAQQMNEILASLAKVAAN